MLSFVKRMFSAERTGTRDGINPRTGKTCDNDRRKPDACPRPERSAPERCEKTAPKETKDVQRDPRRK